MSDTLRQQAVEAAARELAIAWGEPEAGASDREDARTALAAAEPFIRAQVVAEIAALLRSDRSTARIGYERAQRIAELVECEFGGTP